jgi:hypothetical protein
MSGSASAPTKMTITAYTDTGFTTKVTGTPNPFTAWINPSSYNYSRQISYNDRQAQGSPGTSPEFNRIADEDVSFDLIFDATGVLPVPTGQSYSNGVADILTQFTTLVATVNGAIHSPNYLIVGWAQLQFQCVLSSLKIDYTLFMPNGTPLRAKVSVTFKSYTSEAALAKASNKTSPDLSHVITVVAGDTLPDLCYQIYGDSSYYAQVAHWNGLLSFRSLTPGTSLLFPPLRGATP